MKSSYQKKCFFCSNSIDIKKDKHIQLNTLNLPNVQDDYVYFHFNCFVRYWDEKIEERARSKIAFMQKQAMSIFNDPMIKDLLNQVAGSKIALNMLNMPLKADPVLKQQIKAKIKNGKRKTKRSAKEIKA